MRVTLRGHAGGTPALCALGGTASPGLCVGGAAAHLVQYACMGKFYYGGQAVIEGVMMRGQRHMAVAVRTPQGDIVVHHQPLNAGLYRHPLMKLPFLRGLLSLSDALGLGVRALMFSANVAAQEEMRPVGRVAQPSQDLAVPFALLGDAGGPSNHLPKGQVRQSYVLLHGQQTPDTRTMWLSLGIALVFMVSFFFLLPAYAANLLTGLGLGTGAGHSAVVHNLIEGAIRLALFIGYIWLVGHMPDMKRVFGYHGAEHKTINAYEAGAPLTPESVQRFTVLNPRCGTTFLLVVLVLATIVFALLGGQPVVLGLLWRVVVILLVAAVAYEFIRFMANIYHVPVVRFLLTPALALQKMTTRRPDLSMIEVAIIALQVVLVADGVLQPDGAGLQVGGSSAAVLASEG